MCLLLETIKIEHGEIRNLEYHNRRFNSSRKALFGGKGSMNPGIGSDIDLGSVISVPPDIGQGVFRCRVLYRSGIESIEFVPHQERIVRSLKLVRSDNIDYSVKYADRKLLGRHG